MFTGPLMITRCWCAWTGTASCWCGARPARPGAPLAYYHEYQRNGVSNLIMLLAPLEGWPRVGVRDRRTRTGWAEVVRKLVDEDYPGRERIVLGMDNLNTHHPSSLCEAFEPAEDPADSPMAGNPLQAQARQLDESCPELVEGMAGLELGVRSKQCLDRRIPDWEVPTQETGTRQQRRNWDGIRVDWRFTAQDA